MGGIAKNNIFLQILPPQLRMSETVLTTRSCGHFPYMVPADSDTSTDLDCLITLVGRSRTM